MTYEPPKWQDISTAPFEVGGLGETWCPRILGYFPRGQVLVVQMSADQWLLPDDDDCSADAETSPSHWMPLPEPPTPQGKNT